MKQLIVLFGLLLAAAGCTKENNEFPTGEQSFDFTRAGEADEAETGRTYRFMVYSADSTMYRYTGTYVNSANPMQAGILVPCQVDDEGTLVLTDGQEYNPDWGVHLVNRTYSISVVSPAVKFNAGTWNTFDIHRNKPILATGPQQVAIDGYGIYAMNHPLIDRRMRIEGINFIKADGIQDFSLSNVTIVNAGLSGLYHANNHKVEPLGADPVITVYPVGDTEKDDFAAKYPAYEGELYYTYIDRGSDPAAGADDDGKMPVFLFHSCFGQHGVLPLALRFDMTMNGNTNQMRLPLVGENFAFEPSKTYRLNLTVKTTLITLQIEILHDSDWDDGSTGSEEVGKGTEVITVGSWNLNNWNNGGNPGNPEVIG